MRAVLGFAGARVALRPEVKMRVGGFAIAKARSVFLRRTVNMCVRGLSIKGSQIPPGQKAPASVEQASPSKEEEGGKKKSFADMLARHGPVFAVYWATMWAAGAGALWTAIEYNGPQTALALCDQVGLGKFMHSIDPKLGNFALALGMNEVLELVRFPFVVATTPAITRTVERVTGRSMDRKPGKFSLMMKEHGLFFLGYWTSTWAVTGLGCYAGIQLFGPEAGFEVLRFLSLDKIVDLNAWDPSVGNVALAVLMNEALEPLRLPIVIATLPGMKRVIGWDKRVG